MMQGHINARVAKVFIWIPIDKYHSLITNHPAKGAQSSLKPLRLKDLSGFFTSDSLIPEQTKAMLPVFKTDR
jgi:hypothetical protein